MGMVNPREGHSVSAQRLEAEGPSPTHGARYVGHAETVGEFTQKMVT